MVDNHFAIYHGALNNGLSKLWKYYSQFDEKPVYILVLFLHPYYKLDYIKMAWGGTKEKAEEIKAGNKDVKDWKDKV